MSGRLTVTPFRPVVVVADDFGRSLGVNAGVLQALEVGLVRHATDGFNPKEKELLETMIATKEMPVTVGVFVRPYRRQVVYAAIALVMPQFGGAGSVVVAGAVGLVAAAVFVSSRVHRQVVGSVRQLQGAVRKIASPPATVATES